MKNLKKWAKCASVRAIRTMAQTAAGLISASALIAEVNWSIVISTTLLAGLYCILLAVGVGLPEVKENGS